MFSITLKRSVTTLAVMAGLLAAAGPAGASSSDARVDRHDALVFSGDAYDNEMGITNAGPDGGRANLILMADPGGQFSRTGPSADGIIAVLIGL
jgi:hypothetical protein